jgi:hypothetical protein
MKQLWAPWRMVYIDQETKETGCIFCNRTDGRDNRQALVLAHTEHTLVMLNKYPYNNGHLLLAPTRHEKHLSQLSGPEYVDLNETLRRSLDIVRSVFNPGGINLGMNLGKCAGAGWRIICIGISCHAGKATPILCRCSMRPGSCRSIFWNVTIVWRLILQKFPGEVSQITPA